MLVIMLNFIIAIIDQTYISVNRDKNIFVYMNKAELNQECYQLMKYFKKLEPMRVILFSTSKQLYDEDNAVNNEEELESIIDNFRKFLQKQNEESFQIKYLVDMVNDLLQK